MHRVSRRFGGRESMIWIEFCIVLARILIRARLGGLAWGTP
jgi:hypothetical protein